MSSARSTTPDSIETILARLSEPRFPKVDEMLGKIFDARQFENLTLLEREEAVLDFLSQNRERWHNMLVREGLFTGQTPENMHAVSTRCAIEKSNRKLIPILIDEVRKLDFRFIEVLKNSDGLSETLPLDLIDIEIRALKRLSGRGALKGPLEIIRSDAVERYTQTAEERDGVIAGMALAPLKKRLNLREINHCVKTALLLKNSIYITLDPESILQSGFTEKQAHHAIRSIQAKYPRVPSFLLKMALYANLNAETTVESQAKIPAVARFVSLLADLGANIISSRQNDSGLQELESNLLSGMREHLPDEYKESVDGRLLEELIVIAEEESW